MSTKLERRILSTEFRTAKNGKSLVGYAAVFNSLSEDLGGFREKLMPGCFTNVLASGPDVVALFNHEPSLLLGRTTSGTMTLEQDDKGLRYCVDVADTQTGRDVLTLAARGDLSKSSFAFRVDSSPGSERWYDEAGNEVSQWGGVLRVIYRMGDLADCSPVTRPAYTESSVNARSLFYFPEGRGAIATGDARDNAQAFLTARTTIRKSRRDLDTSKELRKMAQLRKEFFI